MSFISGYKYTGSFRYWCQHVLPAVYDDSLSYYELLCKVVKYLNDVISNVDTLYSAVKTLNDYVKDYFDNLDVQDEINNKLDEMAEDGTLSNIVGSVVHVYSIGYVNNGNNVQKTQYCNFIKTPRMNILIDTGWYNNSIAFENMVNGLDINNLDVIIITHYHSDHCGNLAKILQLVPHENCIAYLPPDVVQSVVTDTVYTNMTTVKSVLETNGIPIADNYDTIVDGDVSIEFYNTDHNAYYLSSAFDYNNCCITPLIKSGICSTYFASDVAFEAQEYLATVLPPVKCLSISHHGYNEWMSKAYYNRVQADEVFVCDGYGKVNENEGTYALFNHFVNHISTEAWYYQNKGVAVHSTSYAPNNLLQFDMSRYGILWKTIPMPAERIMYKYDTFDSIFDNTWVAENVRTKTIYEVLNAMHNNSMVEGLITNNYFFAPKNVTDTCYMKIIKTNSGYVKGSFFSRTFAIVEVIDFSSKSVSDKQVYNFYNAGDGTGWQMAMRNEGCGNYYRYDIELEAGDTDIQPTQYTINCGNDISNEGQAINTFVGLVCITANGTDIDLTVDYGDRIFEVVDDQPNSTLVRMAILEENDVVRVTNNSNTASCDVDILIVCLGYNEHLRRNSAFPTSVE